MKFAITHAEDISLIQSDQGIKICVILGWSVTWANVCQMIATINITDELLGKKMENRLGCNVTANLALRRKKFLHVVIFTFLIGEREGKISGEVIVKDLCLFCGN